MKKRWFGYAAWLALALALYFFENNTGTRIVLLCSLLLPLIPGLFSALFLPEEKGKAQSPKMLTVSAFLSREAEEMGDVRLYRPGDPVRRIHWKLSAKKDELLIRETAQERETAEEKTALLAAVENRGKAPTRRAGWLLAAGVLACLALLLLIPSANRGAQALCNRVFAASEAVNAYAYDYFPVPANQSVALAAALMLTALCLLAALTALLRSRPLTLSVMAFLTLFQIYFGLSFPGWVNLPLYGLLALAMMRFPLRGKALRAFGAAAGIVLLLVTLLLPGVDAATEAASEDIRDRLSQMAQQMTNAFSEAPSGETETRHVHTQSLETGENEARTGREYRLVTVEEEQISMPQWVNYLKVFLLLLLSVALVSLPFAPFVLLNARKKKAQAARRVFVSENVGEAVCAIFGQVIKWLDETGCGTGNRLYREVARHLPDSLPEGYAARFARCAEDFEEAAYSAHAIAEEKRQRALALLKETENALWKTADFKQKIRLKYWMCLCE